MATTQDSGTDTSIDAKQSVGRRTPMVTERRNTYVSAFDRQLGRELIDAFADTWTCYELDAPQLTVRAFEGRYGLRYTSVEFDASDLPIAMDKPQEVADRYGIELDELARYSDGKTVIKYTYRR